MKKIKTYFQEYLKKNSNLKIAGDIIFYLFILLLIIPVTRKEISTALIKATLRKPGVSVEAKLRQVDDLDYIMAMKRVDGTVVNLSDFNGEVILLNFWATWCPPCRAEMPELLQAARDYPDLAMLAVNVRESPESVSQFAEQFRMDVPVVLDPQGEISDRYNVSGLPTSIFIDADGAITAVRPGAINRAVIDQILQR
jgi:thiol-disulfide isomerase/thioredoxin